jgi:hypothetical protein
LLRHVLGAAVLRSTTTAAGELLLRADHVRHGAALLRGARAWPVGGADLFHAHARATDLSDRLPALSVNGLGKSLRSEVQRERARARECSVQGEGGSGGVGR